jgi:nicotinamide phosphoribosyltransferase
MEFNRPLLTDSYKPTHAPQYPPNTTKVYSYLESRGGPSDVVFAGLQPILKRHLMMPVTYNEVNESLMLLKTHFGTDAYLNRKGWDRILNVHSGYLPVMIRAVPEGSIIPSQHVLMTVENTDPELPWITNYIESLLVQVWYPTTVATYSWRIKQVIRRYMETTADSLDKLPFMLHDFGFRGASSPESAALGGVAHLFNFMGTDTLVALDFAARYYDEVCAGFSIPAAEHSTITAWGREHEVDAYRNMLEQFPTGLVAVVSDSYDVYRACLELWGSELRQRVLERDGVLVIRPDSGNPCQVVPELLEILGKAFGTVTNKRGFKLLNPKVRLIQGDGIDLEMVEDILYAVFSRGWSAENLAFGSGGALLQKHDRDEHKFAFKCSYVERDGQPVDYDVCKNPVTDPGKRSKAGRLALTRTEGKYQTISGTNVAGDLLQPVFNNGGLLRDESLKTIRARVEQHSLVKR